MGGGGYPSSRLYTADRRLCRRAGKDSADVAVEGRRLEPETGFCDAIAKSRPEI